MTRQQKYPDTSTFHFYNANPKNRLTGDCAFRAICTALEKPWEDVVMEMAEASIKTGYSISSVKGIAKYLEEHGWHKMPQPRKSNGTKYTGEEFCKKIAVHGQRYVANIGGSHVVAIVDKKVYDTWNSTDGCIGNYWVKG